MHEPQVTKLHGGEGISLGAFDPTVGGEGWVTEEHRLTGEATAWRSGPGGLMTLDRSPYSTRIVVRRPADPSRASDDVVVEWLNVTVGSDHAFDWVRTHVELERTGTAWVGVSAQAGGVEASTGGFGRTVPALADLDPERYSGLHHPGDRYAHDVFAQAVRAVRSRPDLVGGPVRHVVAMGHSQSASLLARHVVDVLPHLGHLDGVLVHGRGADAPPLDGSVPRLIQADAPPTLLPPRGPARVLQVLAETDVVALGAHRARQEDDESIVTWEVAGGAHVDTYLLRGASDPGREPLDSLRRRWEPSPTCFGERLDRPMNSGPQRHVLAAALRALLRWVAHGEAPSPAPRLELGADGSPVLDEHGIARGGLRTPAVDAAIACHRGLGNSGTAAAYLCGTTGPIPGAPPVGDDEAVDRAGPALEAAIARGHLLEDDADEVLALARLEAERTR